MGPLMLIGGHEEPTGEILESFARTVGDEAAIALVTTATEDPEGAYRRYRESFTRLGCAEVWHIATLERADCSDPQGARRLREAGGIFFTGGDQLRITSLFGGTAFEDALRAASAHGAVVGGTSAGASAMSATMLVGGAEDASARRSTVTLCPGLGLLRDAVVDQHFAQRGRINRLLAALSQNPGTLGLGIDENTAVMIFPEGRLRVLGSGTVTVLDARPAGVINASEADAEAPLAFGPVALWVLPQGATFDLAHRQVLHTHVADGDNSQALATR